MKLQTTLLNSKSILDCNEEEWEIHNQEIFDIVGRVQVVPDYDCAMVCKFQDRANCHQKQEIRQCSLREILSVTEAFDCRNGMDLYLDEDSYLCMMLYGQSYEMDGQFCMVTLAVKVMPYDDNRNFVDISGVLLGDDLQKVAEEQYNHDINMMS